MLSEKGYVFPNVYVYIVAFCLFSVTVAAILRLSFVRPGRLLVSYFMLLVATTFFIASVNQTENSWRWILNSVLAFLIVFAGVFVPRLLTTKSTLRLLQICLVMLAVSPYLELAGIIHWTKGVGRLSGLLGNPNDLATTICLLLSVLLMVPEIGKGRKSLFLVISFAGVAATLSRGGMLLFLLNLGMFLYSVAFGKDEVGRAYYLTVIAILFALIGLAIGYVLSEFQFAARLTRTVFGSEFYPTTDSRVALVELTFREILLQPFLGAGLGITESWPQRTHNLYLEYWLNLGLAGIVWVVGLFGLLGYLALTTLRRNVIAFVLVACVSGLFNHALIESYYFPMLLGIMLSGAFSDGERDANIQSAQAH